MNRFWRLAPVAALLTGCVGYGYPGDGYSSGGGYYGGGYGGSGGGYDRPSSSGAFRCESNDDRTRECSAGGRGSARLVRQLSDAPCVEGRSWGRTRNGVWVSNGCRAEFVAGAYGPGPGRPDYGGGGQGGTFRCESNDNRTKRCSGGRGGDVRLVRQLSDSPCIEGRSWGRDGSGVWVSNGCRAEFSVGRGGGWNGGGWNGGSSGRTLRCESVDNHRNRCSANIRGGAQLVRKLSDSGCNQGKDWGWDRSGVWVDNGCRAEFRVY